MKPLYALSIAAALSSVSFSAFSDAAEAASIPGSGITRPLALPVQYNPLQHYSPYQRQHSLAGRAAYCRCYPGHGFSRMVCRYPGGPTTTQLV